MDVSDNFENLRVSDDLFKDVKFYVTGVIDEKVLKLLTDGGGKQDAHITDYLTHLITGDNPSEDEIGEVKDIYEKPVITQKWVIASVKCGKQLPVEAFSPDTGRFFSGVVACLSKLGVADSYAVWAMITFHGGHCTLQLNNRCTHLIIAKPEGDKYTSALKHEDQISIVTPDWVTETLEEKTKLDETEYHPRLLIQPRSEEMQQLSTPVMPKERRRKPVYHQPKVEEVKKKEEKKKEPEKSLFDNLQFSDEDESDGFGKGMSLLDQLKTPQSWKQPSTKPTVSTRTVASTISNSPFQSVQKSPTPPSTAQPILAAALSPSTASVSLGASHDTTTRHVPETTVQESIQSQIIENVPQAMNPVALSVVQPSPVPAPLASIPAAAVEEPPPQPLSSADVQNVLQDSVLPSSLPDNEGVVGSVPAISSNVSHAGISMQSAASRTTPPVPSRLTPPNVSRATPPQVVQSPTSGVARATPPGVARSTPPNSSRTTPPFIQGIIPPPLSQSNSHIGPLPPPQSSSRATPPNMSRATPPNIMSVLPPAGTQVGQSVPSRTTPPGVVGALQRAPAMPPTVTGPTIRAVIPGAPGGIPSPSMPSTAPQQVHTVAIPGAVVRLPHGVTPHELQRMTPNQRQAFLHNLHQKQLQEQQGRGKPRAGKPPGPQYKQGIRFAAPGILGQPSPATAGTPAPGTPSSTWPGGNPGNVVRPLITTGSSGAGSVTYPSSQMRTQTATGQSTTTGSPAEGAQPGWPAQGQQQQQYPSGQPPPGTRVIVNQTVWQQQQQQSQPQPASQAQQPQVQQQPQQQQAGIRPQNPSAPGQPPAGPTLLPQHMQQVQLQIQQLCQHFPHLSHQEASQLIQRIPAHFRHIQQLDNAQRSDYLAQLESKERQVVTYFILRKQQQQIYQRQQLLQQQHQQQQQQQQQKVVTPQQSPHSWQQQQQPPGQQPSQPQPVQGGQYPPMSPHGRPLPSRPLPQGYTGVQPGGVVSPGQGSPHMVAGGQLTPQQQLTPHVSPLASPHGHSPIQRGDGAVIGHATVMQGSPVPQNLVNQQNLVNPKTKTALAIHLTNRLAGGVHQGGVLPQGPQVPMEIQGHVVQKQPAIPQEAVQGPSGEQVMMYPRRTLGNITGTVTNNLLRPPSQGAPTAGTAVASTHAYPRPNPATHSSSGSTPGIAPTTPHYPRPHLVGHDTNIMLPRELCLVGCVFYIADYHGDVNLQTLLTWKRLIQQHGGEVVPLYDSARVTHLLCKHQKSPVFMQAVRENKRCITIFWLNDVLLRGKMAPPWQAIHLPTPFGNDNKPCKDLIVSVSGFENEERTIIKLMLQLVGAKYSGCFSKHNNLLVCKKLEGAKVTKAKEWKRPVVNGVWLSEVLLGQNTPPLVYHGTRYQHYLDDPLRIDPSLASHLFNAWKYPISVSKESVEKAKAVREIALRKRKSENDGDQENKRSRLEPPISSHLGPLPSHHPSSQSSSSHGQGSANGVSQGSGQQQAGFRGPLTIINKELPPEQQRPRILLSSVKNKEEVERKILELGGYLARTSVEATHLVMGGSIAQRTVKFMCAISCCQYVVSLQWVTDSHNEARFLREQNYIMEMPEFERVFQFSLRDTLTKPHRRHLFTGKTFYLTPTVVPGRTWLKEIIECAGGTVDNKLRSLKDVKERNKDGAYQYMIIAATADSHLVRDFLRESLPVFNAEFVLGSILKQEIDYEMAQYWNEE